MIVKVTASQILTPCGQSQRGDVLEVADWVGDRLIAKGHAELLDNRAIITDQIENRDPVGKFDTAATVADKIARGKPLPKRWKLK